MRFLQKILSDLRDVRKIAELSKMNYNPINITGLAHIHKAHFVPSIATKLEKKAALITSDESSARRLYEDISAIIPAERCLFFAARDLIFHGSYEMSRELMGQRMTTLSKLQNGEYDILITSYEAACRYTIPPEKLSECSINISVGDTIQINKLAELLTTSGYVRREKIDGSSQFAIRGGIVDFFTAGEEEPIRIEFYGNEVFSINHFDIITQRRNEQIPKATIVPASELLYDSEKLSEQIEHLINNSDCSEKFIETAKEELNKLLTEHLIDNPDKYINIIYDKPATLFDYLDPQKTLLFISEVSETYTFFNKEIEFFIEELKHHMENGTLCNQLSKFSINLEEFDQALNKYKLFFLNNFATTSSHIKPEKELSINTQSLPDFKGLVSDLVNTLSEYLNDGFSCIIQVPTERSVKTLSSDLTEKHIPLGSIQDTHLQPKTVYVIHECLSAGFTYPDDKIAFITQYGSHVSVSTKQNKSKKNTKALTGLDDLKQGDLVVHMSHGIGIFDEITQLEFDKIVKDYIKIKYQGSDVLYVPVTQMDLVSKYIAPRDENSVKLNKLNSTDWQKTRTKVKKKVSDMAKELIKLYAKRHSNKGFQFSKDNEKQKNFEERFEHDETDDQLRCCEEIKMDMEREYPMDRLLCGDVGVGKTEVAFRAAFKCVANSKQCAILAPTTILATQHFNTAIRRFEGFNVNIEVLSRFKTPKQQKAILERVKQGEVDILVGTHRIVQKDVQFKDIGLCIIDEEQRFGVADKEKFKKMCTGIDVLTLSATPIPRTLNLAMSGIRDISSIDEPPKNRHPIQTLVIEHDYILLKQAIERELRRGGQVYYLHNRIDSIDSTATILQKLLPTARISVAHGKMSEHSLSKVWQNLLDGETDILVSTSLIETGVDVSNVNTLIIEDADNIGLSSLYQLRGRVGRSSRRAFCYLTFKKQKVLSEIASKRLTAIKDFTKFGSGFKIAMRDMEIRGAGNVLGGEQHGHLVSVGYDMYMKLLSEAIDLESGHSNSTQLECTADIKVSAHIDPTYISSLTERLEIYKKIADVRTIEDKNDIIDELIDRFGTPPVAVTSLLDVALLRNRAAKQGISEILQKNDRITFFKDEVKFPFIKDLINHYKRNFLLNSSGSPGFAIKSMKDTNPIELINNVLDIIEKADHPPIT